MARSDDEHQFVEQTGLQACLAGAQGMPAYHAEVQLVGPHALFDGGIWLTVLGPGYPAWLAGAALQGLGTAMVYPTLLAAIADHAEPTWRASSLGVYRFWRDLGYAVGALLSGLVADFLGFEAAIHLVAALTLASGLLVARLMRAPTPRAAAVRV